MDTINRLLKKQAPKRRGKISAAEVAAAAAAAAGGVATPDVGEDPEEEAAAAAVERPDPRFVRWVSNREGCRVGVPGEWRGTGAGRVFGESGWAEAPVQEVQEA